MKKVVFIFYIILLFSCSSTKTQLKTKTFSNENMEVKYPKTWFKFGGLGYAYFKPKETKDKLNPEDGNYLLTNKSIILLENSNVDIEKVLYEYGNTLTRNQKAKGFKLIKANSKSRFLYKMVSTIEYNFSEKTFKRE